MRHQLTRRNASSRAIQFGLALVLTCLAMPAAGVRAQPHPQWLAGQGALHDVAPPAVMDDRMLPAPVYWKQTLFQIPYQWGTAAEPGAAQVVWLLVSKDRGITWQKISEAKPHVTSFSYRAEAEGEYWFAVRTLDREGRQWPAGDYQPELRVIVDTTMPRIEALHAIQRGDGSIDIQWCGSDLNLDPSSWRIEAQADPLGNWQLVPQAGSTEQEAVRYEEGPGVSVVAGAAGAVSAGRTIWRPPAGLQPITIRATVLDRAGNSASFQTHVTSAAGTTAPMQMAPPSDRSAAFRRLPPTDTAGGATASPAGSSLFNLPARDDLARAPAAFSVDSASLPPGWDSSSATATGSSALAQRADQAWPASITSRAPFRLSNSTPAAVNDAVTAYGNPIGAPGTNEWDADTYRSKLEPSTHDRYALNGEPRYTSDLRSSSDDSAGPVFQSLPAYRQASADRSPADKSATANVSNREADNLGSDHRNASPVPYGDNLLPWDSRPQVDQYVDRLPPGVQPKLVGSRTFALEYELEQVGRWGVSNVELWGTRDGGRTWRRFVRDDDSRSPLVVTVDEEGLYGFRIVVESSGAPAVPPVYGDEPELWVAVDLNRPVAELTAARPGEGNLADHLILQWRAADDNLEPRPISLYYSSRPAGPWSAIATNLQNTGEYAWRVERHVPTRFYLRLEARDTAGNLAAFQTREPIEFAAPAPGARLRAPEPIDPTATGGGVSYR